MRLKNVQYTICSVLNVRKLRCNLNSFLQHEIFRNIWVGGGVGWGGDDQVQEEYSISNNTCICNLTDAIYMFTCTVTLNMK